GGPRHRAPGAARLSRNGLSMGTNMSTHRKQAFCGTIGKTFARPEPMAEKLRPTDDIGGPDSHTNFPHGWPMASNTPLRRYKQNTHGGGIRDPFVTDQKLDGE